MFSVTNDAMPQVEYFSISSSTQDDGAIRDFIENDEITILAATATDQTVCFQHRLPTEETCLLFYKIPQLRAPPTNVPGDVPVGILTLEGGLVKSIYNSVLRVYSPHVTKVRHFEVGIMRIEMDIGVYCMCLSSVRRKFEGQQATASNHKMNRKKSDCFHKFYREKLSYSIHAQKPKHLKPFGKQRANTN